MTTEFGQELEMATSFNKGQVKNYSHNWDTLSAPIPLFIRDHCPFLRVSTRSPAMEIKQINELQEGPSFFVDNPPKYNYIETVEADSSNDLGYCHRVTS